MIKHYDQISLAKAFDTPRTPLPPPAELPEQEFECPSVKLELRKIKSQLGMLRNKLEYCEKLLGKEREKLN